MTDEELVVEFALTRLDHPDADLGGRGTLRGPAFESAVDCGGRLGMAAQGGGDVGLELPERLPVPAGVSPSPSA